MLRISVVIPTHNHARFVSQAIDSALAQTRQPREVIVVDDGSTDETLRLLEAYRDRIRVLRQARQGVATARNAGAALTTGDLLAFLDADDVWLPAKLERQVARFERESNLGLVHCGIEEIDGGGRCLARKVDGLEGWVAEELLLFRRSVIIGGGSGVVVSRAAFDDVEGFDEKMSTSADWDFYYRVARRYKVGFVPEVLLQYRVHGSNMHWNIRAMERDMLRGYGKAFSESGGRLDGLRRRAYGNLHSVLAGSFFSAGQYRPFCEHAVKSLLLTPKNISHFLGYPLRWWRRQKNTSLVRSSEDAKPLFFKSQLDND